MSNSREGDNDVTALTLVIPDPEVGRGFVCDIFVSVAIEAVDKLTWAE